MTDVNRIRAARPKRAGRVFLAGLLLGFDLFALLIWAVWLTGFLRGSDGLMTVNDVPVPVAYALPFGLLALSSLGAVWLISMLRAYPIVLGIAIMWLAYALIGYVSGSFAVGVLLATRVAIVALLVSGRPAFRA